MGRMRNLMLLGVPLGSGSGAYTAYDLYDTFDTDLAAGEVNGTLATDGVNVRTIVDSDGNKHSITAQKMSLLPLDTFTYGNPRLTYPAVMRALGRSLTFRSTSAVNTNVSCGFFSPVGTAGKAVITKTGDFIAMAYGQGGNTLASRYSNYLHATAYQQTIILRASGFAGIVKYAGVHRLGILSSYDNTASLYPQFGPHPNGSLSLDNVQIPKKLWFPTPLASDSFNRADGAVGNTDGAGHAEAAAEYGSGGSGKAWAANIGTWGIASNKLMPSALDGGKAIATVDVSEGDVYVSAYLTRSAGTIGLVARYVDANNYIYLIHDGTSVIMGKVVGGVDTVLHTTAKTYRAGGEMALWVDGSQYAGMYVSGTPGILNNISTSYPGFWIEDAVLQQSGKVGIITTDTGNSAENFTAWPRHLTDFPFDIKPNAKNADANLHTPTYDGSNTAVHPDVYYNASGWNGYAYWMVMTPYPGSDSAYENPSILVSHDGLDWYLPPGITNPIVAAPADPDGAGPGLAWNADPDIVVAPDDTMWLFYLYQEHYAGEVSQIRITSSTDGITWAAPENLFDASYREILSPTVLYDGSQYVMWYVNGETDAILKRTCATPNGTWSAASAVTGTYPTNRNPWHIDVVRDGTGYKMYCNMRVGTTRYGTELWIARSEDGAAWTWDTAALLTPSETGWDNNRIYRATAQKIGNDWHVWYSALGSTWHIGHIIE